MKSRVLIIECIPKKERKREGTILYEFIKMISPEKVDPPLPGENKKLFFEILRKDDSRYVHISCHGVKRGSHLLTLNKGRIRPTDFQRGSLKGRYVAISGCRLGKIKFARPFLEHTGAKALIAPRKDILFQDSALFWVCFYYNLLQRKLTFKGSAEAAYKKLPYIEGDISLYL